MNREDIYFDNLIRGWDPVAPPRALRSDTPAIWRDSENLSPREGLLRRRLGIITMTPQPNETIPSLGETVVYVASFRSPQDDLATTIIGSCAQKYEHQGTSAVVIVVTNRQIYIYNSLLGTYSNLTPTYNTGSLTCTNGSPTISGAGTLWLTHNLSPYQLITIDGTTYQLCTVTGEGAATLTTPFTGATGAGKAYSIRRTFPGGRGRAASSLIHCLVFAGNLYVAGSYIGKANGVRSPALVKVSDIFTSTPSSTYLTAKLLLQPGLDIIPDLEEISGVQALQDSRIVLAANQSEIIYSSNLSTAVWSGSPAGRTLLAVRQGAVLALGRLGNSVTAHAEDGIIMCSPTFRDDPPLSFADTAATAGCFAPNTLKTDGGGEFFLGSDMAIHRFDGHSTRPVGESLVRELGGVAPRFARYTMFAAMDSRRNRYKLFNAYSDAGTLEYELDLMTGGWWKQRYPLVVGACSDRDTTSSDPTSGHLLIGLSNLSATSVETDLVARLADSSDTDSIQQTTIDTTAPRYFATTDDLDWGKPTQYKSLQKVILWILGIETGTDQVLVHASRDGGATWVTAGPTSVVLSTTEEKPVQFSFIDAIAGSTTYRIKIEVSNTSDPNQMRCCFTRFIVVAQVGGEIELVEL
jgi:hypothetical protein